MAGIQLQLFYNREEDPQFNKTREENLVECTHQWVGECNGQRICVNCLELHPEDLDEMQSQIIEDNVTTGEALASILEDIDL